MHEPDRPAGNPRDPVDSRLTRRSLIRKSGLSALTVAGLPAFLAACGGNDNSKSTTPSSDTQGSTTAAKKISGSIVIASWGGTYNDDLKKYFADPFTAETGVKVKFLANTSLAGVKRQVAAGNVQWDIAELAGSDYHIGVEQNVGFTPLDFNIIDKSNIPEYAVQEFGIQYAFFTQVMAWDKRQIKTPPTTWAEFFDGAKYAPKRSLYDAIYDSFVLEFALLADGVAKDQLYPLDVDRALKALEKLPAKQMLWYSTNAQVIQQMSDKESGLGMPYTRRVIEAVNGGVPLEYTNMNGGALGDFFVVPKGAKNPDAAMAFINFICNNVDAAANFMKASYYGVSNTKAVESLPDDVRSQIPTDKAMQEKNNLLLRDDKWWADNLEAVTQKFQAWQTKYMGS